MFFSSEKNTSGYGEKPLATEYIRLTQGRTLGWYPRQKLIPYGLIEDINHVIRLALEQAGWEDRDLSVRPDQLG